MRGSLNHSLYTGWWKCVLHGGAQGRLAPQSQHGMVYYVYYCGKYQNRPKSFQTQIYSKVTRNDSKIIQNLWSRGRQLGFLDRGSSSSVLGFQCSISSNRFWKIIDGQSLRTYIWKIVFRVHWELCFSTSKVLTLRTSQDITTYIYL